MVPEFRGRGRHINLTKGTTSGSRHRRPTGSGTEEPSNSKRLPTNRILRNTFQRPLGRIPHSMTPNRGGQATTNKPKRTTNSNLPPVNLTCSSFLNNRISPRSDIALGHLHD
ncbi:hypothetical protein GCM10022198_11620 [Klugiella xanthotipulae]|uniref:Uncharacterized protein n=1 Tax=Klugiella xanthotipulae TaxID=244735 RepID=A0A543I4T1_9MICO|nr:hypothetical protein FB466_0400 [Klugiella xanthotipulae]